MKTPSSVNRNAHALDYKSIFCSIISDDTNASALQLKLKDMNWESFVETAQKEKLLPLLYYACKQKHIEHLMPASVLSSMHAAYMNNMGRTFYLKQSLAEVLKAFNDQHIKIMLLKGGAHLVEPLYPDINTRVMSDIDIMVLEEDIPQVKQLFQDMGFTCFPDPWGEANKMNFVKGQLNYELHTRPFSDRKPPVMSAGAMWINARKKQMGESTVFLPAVEDMLYHCIFHELIQHDHLFDLQPSTFYEVVQMLKAYRYKIDLFAFFERARHYRLDAHLSIFFHEHEKMFHTPLPTIINNLIDEHMTQMRPLLQQINQLPIYLREAGKRHFNFTFFYGARHHCLKQFYRYYILSELQSPAEKMLSYYRLPAYFLSASAIVRLIHIAKISAMHVVTGFLISRNETMFLHYRNIK